MYIEVTWLDDVVPSEALAGNRKNFEAEYASRFGVMARQGLYKDDDWARVAFCQAQLARFGGSVLDVGVGPGALLNVLATDPRFDRVTGIDIRHYSKLVELVPDLDLRIMDVREMEFENDAFDTVVCMEVLEHLDDESFEQALAELRRVAGRRLFMTVPFREPKPLLPYHKKRFDFTDIERYFPGADFHLLKRQRGVHWIVILEHLNARAPCSEVRGQSLQDGGEHGSRGPKSLSVRGDPSA